MCFGIGGVQFVPLKTEIPPGQVPNTPAQTYITVAGKNKLKHINIGQYEPIQVWVHFHHHHHIVIHSGIASSL